MNGTRPIYVIDTNVIVDYVDIIPTLSGPVTILEEPTIDLAQAHLVIPSVVIRELSSFKSEKSGRGKAARIALKRIREIFESKLETMDDMYHLRAAVQIEEQLISVLPVHKDFAKGLPFAPSDADMDGQIILVAMTVAYLLNGMTIDGTEARALCERHDEEVTAYEDEETYSSQPKDTGSVTLLTNDNGLALRARERGIQTMRYGYKYPAPYTGRRDLVVPPELMAEFLDSKELPREIFEMAMPNEPKLVANEFIIMSLENLQDYPLDYNPAYDPAFERIGRYDAAKDALVHLSYALSFPVTPKNPGQAIYAEALADPSIAAVICTGPAGSGKTYMSTVYGYRACLAGQFIGVTVVPCESKSKLGALPGDLDEKMDPDVQPLKDALRNYLLQEDSALKKELANTRKYGPAIKSNSRRSQKLEPEEEFETNERGPHKRSIKARLDERVEMIWKNWFSSTPIEIARGRDFAYELAIYDEFQDQNATQADTLVKRIGTDGKIVLTGDVRQIHAAFLDHNNNGLVYASKLLFDDPMIAQVCFTEDEVVRHPLVQLIAKRQKAEKTKKSNTSLN